MSSAITSRPPGWRLALALSLGLGAGAGWAAGPGGPYALPSATFVAAAPAPCDPRRALASSQERRMELGTEPLRVSLALEPSARARLRQLAAPGGAGAVVLNVEGLQAEASAGLVYELYLDLPEGERSPDPKGVHYVGNLSLFGRGAGASSQDYDVTKVARALMARGLWREGELTVTFFPRGLMRAGSGKPMPSAPGPKARFSRVTLTCE